MKSSSLSRSLAPVTIFIGFVFSLLNIFQFAGEPTLGADIVSRVLPAVGHRIGLGAPYVDYWEITPPGHYIVLDIWAQFFGFTGVSIKILHLAVSIGIVLLTYFLLSKFLKGLYLLITAAVIYFFLFSVRLSNFILPSEILGLFFSLAGVSSLFYFKEYKKAVFIASFLLFLSGQIKDPYLLSLFALVPYILFLLINSKKVFFNGIVISILGAISSSAIHIFYLFLQGSSDSYVEILKAKSEAYDVFDIDWLIKNFLIRIEFTHDVFYFVPYSVLIPIIIYFGVKLWNKFRDKSFVVSIVGKSKGKILSGKLNWSLEKADLWIFIFYIIGLLVGFVMLRSLGSHYYIIAVFPLVSILAICFAGIDWEFSKIKKNKILRVAIFSLFLLLILPEKAYFTDYNFERLPELRFIPKLFLWANNNSISPIVKRISDKTSKSDCIIDIYGWGVGTTYLYAQRKPCSRFYLTNFIIKDWQRDEYRASILANEPKALIYNPSAGDLDNKHFEEWVINFPKVIDSCYIRDPDFKTLYFPKYKGFELKKCLDASLLQDE